jgi:negative regulator of sigma E activity
LNVYTRKLENHLVTVVGEVPAESVRRIAHNVEYRRP